MKKVDYAWWTDERVETLRELIAAGRSASEICKAMGASSRSAICGKAHRLGWKFKGVERPERVRRNAAENMRARRRPNNFAAVNAQRATAAKAERQRPPKAAPKPKAPPPAPVVANDTIGRIKLLGLRFHHCRWPLGMHDGEQTFCGDHRRDGSSYCAGHHAASVSPFHPRQAKTGAQLVRQLRRYAA